MGERIDGTILIDRNSPNRFAETPFGATVQVDWAGKIKYAVIGEPGQRIWWFAGIGSHAEENKR